jgi:hypothetical protein
VDSFKPTHFVSHPVVGAFESSNTDCRLGTQLIMGECLQVINQQNGMSQIALGSGYKNDWVPSHLLRPITAFPKTKLARIIGKRVRVWSDSSLAGELLCALPATACVTLGEPAAASSDGQQVILMSGQTGYVSKMKLQEHLWEPGQPIKPVLPSLEAVARYARDLCDQHYLWGGCTPSQGFDCSGLVMHFFRLIGIELPHSSRLQQKSDWFTEDQPGTELRRCILTAGELLCFGDNHIGFAVNADQFIQAVGFGKYSGQVVLTSKFDNHWNGKFTGLLRLRQTSN